VSGKRRTLRAAKMRRSAGVDNQIITIRMLMEYSKHGDSKRRYR